MPIRRRARAHPPDLRRPRLPCAVDPPAPARRGPAARSRMPWQRLRGSRRSRPAMSSTTPPSDACCRMLSPASARNARSTSSATGASDRRPPPQVGQEMERLFKRYLKDTRPVARSIEIRRALQLQPRAAALPISRRDRVAGRTPQQELERLTWEKAPDRYPDGVTPRSAPSSSMSCKLIAELDYAPYFLTVHAIVAEARRREILCQGRGSAANRRSAMSSASPRSTRCAPSCCSSASSAPSGASRPTSTSISSMSARGSDPVDLRDLWPQPQPR
jgi:hypothetical protein